MQRIYAIESLADELSNKFLEQQRNERYILGITGTPGSGKSTLASSLVTSLNHRKEVGFAALVPLDGFHYPESFLLRRGWSDRKGAPYSFNVEAYYQLLRTLRDEPSKTTLCPSYDRSFGDPVPDTFVIGKQCKIVITEGIYLLLTEPSWDKVKNVLDESWYLDVPLAITRQRVIKRHIFYGRTHQAAIHRFENNDLLNTQTVRKTRHLADKIFCYTDLMDLSKHSNTTEYERIPLQAIRE